LYNHAPKKDAKQVSHQKEIWQAVAGASSQQVHDMI